jgi:uncharacterized protein YdhG (YjbR/CyaY superfamily)
MAATVDEYLAQLPDERRGPMEALRRAVTTAAPEATEAIAYGMPALRSHGGQFLVSYDAFQRHFSLFPASDAVIGQLGDEIRPYLSGSGTIRFPANQPIPTDLVERIVRIRWQENEARAAARGGKDRRA